MPSADIDKSTLASPTCQAPTLQFLDVHIRPNLNLTVEFSSCAATLKKRRLNETHANPGPHATRLVLAVPTGLSGSHQNLRDSSKTPRAHTIRAHGGA